MDDLSHKQVLPDLPTEIIVLVGQFLAGNHAFGTLAALHTTSHALKEETTPILYETLFLDNKDNMPFYFQDAGVEKKMIKYAKSVYGGVAEDRDLIYIICPDSVSVMITPTSTSTTWKDLPT